MKCYHNEKIFVSMPLLKVHWMLTPSTVLKGYHHGELSINRAKEYICLLDKTLKP